MAAMNILFDFGAIKTGGGVQLAVNFLGLLDRLKPSNMNIFLLIPEIGELSKLCLEGNYAGVFVSPNSFSKRFLFEYIHLHNLIRRHKITHIFTFFGAGLPHPKDVRSVVTVAYPVICYPESTYWKFAGKKDRAYICCLNVLRRSRLRSASAIIAETNVMRERIARSIKFPAAQICVIPPTPSQYVAPVSHQRRVPSHRFLFISGTDSHKNLWRLPAIAQCMLERGVTGFMFLLTSSREAYLKSLKAPVACENVINRHFTFLGPIPPQRIMEAYSQADIIVSLSDLESFSNNYMEAWTARLPLVVSDRDFSRHICESSAVYVEPHEPANVAEQLSRLSIDISLQAMLVKAGDERLSLLPSQEKRFTLIMAKLQENQEELDNETHLGDTKSSNGN